MRRDIDTYLQEVNTQWRVELLIYEQQDEHDKVAL